MKNKSIILTVLFLSIGLFVFAGTGYAFDGLVFLLSLICILLFVLFLLFGISFLSRNGKSLIVGSYEMIKRWLTFCKKHIFDYKSRRLKVSY